MQILLRLGEDFQPDKKKEEVQWRRWYQKAAAMESSRKCVYGPVTQLGECYPCKVEVESSSLFRSTNGIVYCFLFP